MNLRSAVERTSHRIVVRRRLPRPFESARIYVSTEGGLRYLARPMANVDPVLLRLVDEVVRPGDTVWDIGANLGLFSFAAAVRAGRRGQVLAVEPDTDLVGLLHRSAAGGVAHAPVEVLPAAVSDELSVGRFHIARRNRSTSHLAGFGSSMTGGTRSTRLVPTVTLDSLAARFPAPDVIKVDVEGAEVPVLAGGSRVLSLLPTLICEVSGGNAKAVAEILTGHGYTLYDGARCPGERAAVPVAPFNTLAVALLGEGVQGTRLPAPGRAPNPCDYGLRMLRYLAWLRSVVTIGRSAGFSPSPFSRKSTCLAVKAPYPGMWGGLPVVSRRSS